MRKIFSLLQRPDVRRAATGPRALLACVTVVLLSGIGGCGGAGANPGSAHEPSSGTPWTAALAHERDGDADNDRLGAGPPYDADNDAVPTYGRAAGKADARAVAAIVRLYYAAAATDDGRAACSLLQPTAAEALVEQYGPRKGPPELRGTTCAQIASRLFKRYRRELTEGAATLEVPIVQVRDGRAWAVVDLGRPREYVAFLHRAGTGWKLTAMPGSTQPL
jgi:hypothetical protein